MKINYVNLDKQYKSEQKQLLKKIDECLTSGNWVGSKDIDILEKKIASITDTKYCVALNSGTDALTIGLYLLGIRKGDEVLTPANSFIASTAVIVHLGGKPVFVDVKDDQNIDENEIEKKITKKTKIIMPVHLTGRPCNMQKINEIAKKYKLKVIEDCAQSIMSKYRDKSCGSFGHIGCFSAHPLKNLNASGDGGFLVTNTKKNYLLAKSLRTHGMINRNKVYNFGYVSRLDSIQAVILNFRLRNLRELIKIRRKNFNYYKKYLIKNKNVFFPDEKKYQYNTYHTFVIQVSKRDQLKKFLKKKGVETAIHYPIPIHLQPAAKYLRYKKGSLPFTEKQSKKILTLPINQFLKENEIRYISELINKFYEKKI